MGNGTISDINRISGEQALATNVVTNHFSCSIALFSSNELVTLLASDKGERKRSDIALD